ncbi:MAG TPA: FMN-binding glutamate synthase family protein [Longimicrobiaceae bacterium]|jgi:glutamate synthase domain-containing protein 2
MTWLLAVLAILAAVAVYDVVQRRHAILRNFPVIGHLRYLLESIGPELRQYIVTGNDEERPFSRDQRRWVYASSKRENSYFSFGTDLDLEQTPNHVIFKQATFPLPETAPADPLHPLPCAKVLGGARGRRHAFRPGSIVNVSGMSYGSLSPAAVEALARGAALAGCWMNTGEGGISRHHLHGCDLVWQIGTGYFGCRDERGRFSLERLKETLARAPTVRALEIKLSQGAKPGMGGVLPAAKVSPEIAAARGVPVGRDCISPPHHTAFGDVDGLLDFVEMLAGETGLPVGIKSAVGQMEFWEELVRLMEWGGRGVDFVTVDGGEGGTGAAPLAFTDHMSLPFRLGMSQVYRVFAEAGLHERVVFNGSGKLGFPHSAVVAFALGCDMVGVAREAMLSIGCIQAQRCHTGHCPAGVATQSRWLMRGLDPTLKSARAANYLTALRQEIGWLCRACGVAHPARIQADHVSIVSGQFHQQALSEVFGYRREWGLPSGSDLEILALPGQGREPAGVR